MKILIIGDLHLTEKFDKNKYLYLVSLISKADKVILNGDFYEGVTVSFDKFFNSEWRRLFPLLKSKETVYVIGNHDYDAFPRNETFDFSDEKVFEYKLVQNSKKFYITHGHLYGLTIVDKIKLVRQIKSWFWEPLYEYVSEILIRKYGKRILSLGNNSNKIIETNIRKKVPSNVVIIFSDTHAQISNEKDNIYNTGLFNYGFAQHAIIEDGNVRVVDENY